MPYTLFAILSAIGFAVSAMCHVYGWLERDPPGGEAVKLLHIGIFAVWIPLVIVGKRVARVEGKLQFEELSREVPKWAGVALQLVFVYGLANFVYFIYLTSRYPKHGVPLFLTLRGFSGHWMIFYGFATLGYTALARLARKRNAPGAERPPGVG